MPGIGGITDEAALDRFIQERLEQVPMNSVQGLAGALGSIYAEQLGSVADLALGVSYNLVPGCIYTCPGDGIYIFVGSGDLEHGAEGGFSLIALYKNGVQWGGEGIWREEAERRNMVTRLWIPPATKAGDTFLLAARSTAAGAIARQGHTNLSIVRLR